MDIQKELKGKPNKIKINKIVSYVGNDTNRFSELVSILLKGDNNIQPRAAWALSYCVEKKPSLLIPKYLNLFVKEVKKNAMHDAIKRNIVRALQYVRLPKKNQGVVADLCFQFLENPREAVAIKAFSMTVLANIVKENPEMKRELILIIQKQLPYSSPAFTARAKKTINEFESQLHPIF